MGASLTHADLCQVIHLMGSLDRNARPPADLAAEDIAEFERTGKGDPTQVYWILKGLLFSDYEAKIFIKQKWEPDLE